MDKNTKGILFLIAVSLIIAGVFNFILGALLDPNNYTPVTHENSSSPPGTANEKQDTQFAGNSTADENSLKSDEATQQIPAQTPTSALGPVSTPTAVPTEDYQDAQWIANVQKHTASLSKDVEGLGNISSDSASNEFASYGQYLIEDTQGAIEENKQYEVSSKFQSAKKEWELALNDFSSAGELLSRAAAETNNNVTDSGNTKQALTLVDSGSGHLSKVQEFLKTAS